jgi:hypothetical protein
MATLSEVGVVATDDADAAEHMECSRQPVRGGAYMTHTQPLGV